MTTTIISNMGQYPFGMQTNQCIARIISLNTNLARLQEAVATASSGYEGTAGTEFEVGGPTNVNPAGMMQYGQNLFGVQASSTPGEQGQAYSYAIGQLYTAWQTFWAAAQPYVEQLDNGTIAM
jgi:hypothetical protein